MKKVLALVLSLTLVVTLTVGGSIAYLTSEDSDVNVMTLGNVTIEQHEYERVVDENGDYTTDTIDGVKSYVLKDYTQSKPLMPATEIDKDSNPVNFGAGPYDSTIVRMSQVDSYGYMQVFESKNAQDKFVTVKNTGKSDAYVRTLIAFETGELTYEEWVNAVRYSVHMCWDLDDAKDNVVFVNIGDNNYCVVECVYSDGNEAGARHQNGILTAGETTYPSLSQVYMTATSTNDTVEKLDGNENGMYDILILSQAIQSAGFEDAKTALDAGFGEFTAENVKAWFENAEAQPSKGVATADELTAALAEGGNIILTEDITLDADATLTVAKGASATIDLAGNTLSGTSVETGKNRNLLVVKGDLTVKGGTVTMKHTGDDMGWNNLVSAFSVEGGELTLDGVTINASGSSMAYGVDVNTTLGETVLNIEGNTSITSTYTGVRIFNNHKTATGTVNLNGGTVDGDVRDIWMQKASSTSNPDNGIVNINNGAEYEMTTQDSGSRIYQFK